MRAGDEERGERIKTHGPSLRLLCGAGEGTLASGAGSGFAGLGLGLGLGLGNLGMYGRFAPRFAFDFPLTYNEKNGSSATLLIRGYIPER